MIQRQLKLRLTKTQKATLEEWLWTLTGVWNWAIRKIELDARDGIFHSRFDMTKLVIGHSQKVDVPSKVLEAEVENARLAWDRCFRKLARRPKLKGQRNRLNNIPYKRDVVFTSPTRFRFPVLGSVRFHKDAIPEGRLKQCRFIRRASGWYLCLMIDGPPNPIPKLGDNSVGIDLGFKSLIALSTGETVPFTPEAGKRVAQAQRGRDKQLTSRLQERTANRRKDRNHKLSRRLVAENSTIVVSKDNLRGLARNHFGKSVASTSHGQLRSMLAYKCTQSGRRYIEVSPRNSTRACSSCGSLTGPTGWAGLKVRTWECTSCGAHHDRDVNAAINTLKSGLGSEPRTSGQPLTRNSL